MGMQQSVLEAKIGDAYKCSAGLESPKHDIADVLGGAIDGGDAVSFIHLPVLTHAPV